MDLGNTKLLGKFEQYLKEKTKALPDSRLKKAMEYSLEAGGKRVRPQLLFHALNAYNKDAEEGFPMAAAIEMIHTYSLIHDDMPEMDNDDLRRGKSSCHIAFGSDIALLAGDALQSLAFETILNNYPADKAAPLALLLSQKAGAAGMCYGQDLDLGADDSADLDLLEQIEQYKTGCLIELPLCAAAILADRKEDIPVWDEIGRALGIQFQIQDDLLELSSDAQTMGKSLSDARNQKASAACFFTIEEGQARVDAYERILLEQLSKLDLDYAPMERIFAALKNRTH